MAIDFDKLRASKKKPKSIDPLEIFRRLPKPTGINDLYTSQAEVLSGWFNRRADRDVVVKLHTGGGKTLVGLLMAQSTMNECGEPALYLVPTVQLMNQTIAKAHSLGIAAVPYLSGQPFNEEFVNGSAVLVATYNALFNGRSKFGLRGTPFQQRVGAVISDDAHAAFSVVRDAFTLSVTSEKHHERYLELAGLFRLAFKEVMKLGTFDDVIEGKEHDVLEVPYWAWNEKLDAVREQLKLDSEDHALVWPLLRDRLHLCHALISKSTFTITPILPLVDVFPTFSEAARRIYMSATIADDSEIVRTFDASPALVEKPLSSRSLAGVSERMVLVPELMPFLFNNRTEISKLLLSTVKQKFGSVILVPSNKAAESWTAVPIHPQGSKEVEKVVGELQDGATFGPVIFANRYDGIDLPGNACRLLVMDGLPRGTSDYEIFRASALFGGSTITRLLAQRIEQGIGRGARGSGDFCVVLLVGNDLASWIAKDANFRFLTPATQAQLEIGTEISKRIEDLRDLKATIQRSLDRDQSWIEYHAETLAEYVEEHHVGVNRISQVSAERAAINLWRDGHHAKAITKIEQLLKSEQDIDTQTRGWMLQLSARIASDWGHRERADEFQREAFSINRNLIRPKQLPAYRPITLPGPQAQALAQQIERYRMRRGALQAFEEIASHLVRDASANQFEKALADLANIIGLPSERFDNDGEGPDVLWLLPDRIGLVIEAKSRKKEKNALTKAEHGQLLVAGEWFGRQYPEYSCVRVSVHPKNIATKAAIAEASHALTYEKLGHMISDVRSLLTKICESQRSGENLVSECMEILRDSTLRSDRLVSSYLIPFECSE